MAIKRSSIALAFIGFTNDIFAILALAASVRIDFKTTLRLSAYSALFDSDAATCSCDVPPADSCESE